MLNLAIECSGLGGSVGLCDDNTLIEEVKLASDGGSVQTLAPEIARLVANYGRPAFVSVTHGPGSFTGLRVGLATAKMLAMAWGIQVAPVDTLSAIALEASEAVKTETLLVPVMNAFRKQVFAAVWRKSDGQSPIACMQSSRVIDAKDWCTNPLSACGVSESATRNQPVPAVLCGPGLEVYQPEPSGQWRTQATGQLPSARSVASLGKELFDRGLAVDAISLLPNYIRRSAAEEKASAS